MPNVSVTSILEEGDLFEDNGFVKIKRASASLAATNVGTTAHIGNLVKDICGIATIYI